VKIREAQAMAEALWTGEDTIGVVRRGRKSPRFRVGYIRVARGSIGGVTLGSSDVSWEDAFNNTADEYGRVPRLCLECDLVDVINPDYGICFRCAHNHLKP